MNSHSIQWQTKVRNLLRVLIVLASIATLGGCYQPRAPIGSPRPDGPPNIVFIIADDMGYGDLRCYGAPDTYTPILDKLANEGVKFTQFYANGPECTPTRTAIMTGRYQQRVGGLECAIGTDNVGRYDDAIRLANEGELGLPAEQNTLIRSLKQEGYATGLTGKWHLGYDDKFQPNVHGFDHSFYVQGGNCDYFEHKEHTGRNVLALNGQLIERKGYMTDLITNEAVQFIKDNRKKPFFLAVTHTAPHFPYQGPGDETGELLTHEQWTKGTRKQYIKMLEHMDLSIGRVLLALDSEGLRDNTIVIFISDHGGTTEARNLPYSGLKSTLFEGGIRAPCIVRWPAVLPQGKVIDWPAMTFDLTASMLRMAGAKPASGEELDGIDMVQFVQDEKMPPRRELFWRSRRGDVTWRAMRDGRLKYIEKQEGDAVTEWLFDLQRDPQEKNSLAKTLFVDVEHMKAKLATWETDVKAVR